MTVFRAFIHLYVPCLIWLLSLWLIFRDSHSDIVLVYAILSAAALAWLLIAAIQVAQSYRGERGRLQARSSTAPTPVAS